MMSNTKNKLDEMQEQKLLKIERNGMWFAFWGLFAAIMIQSVIFKQAIFPNLIGEAIIFICLAAYVFISCLKNGIWDRRLNPSPKTNLIISLIAGIFCGLLYTITSYINYHNLIGSLATGAFMFISMFILCIVALTASSELYKKRVHKLENQCEENNSHNR